MTSFHDYLRLDGKGTTFILVSENNAIPEILYWGEKLSDKLNYETLARLGQQPITFSSLDVKVPISILPEANRGYMGHPGLQAHKDGYAFNHRFIKDKFKKTGKGFALYFKDEKAELELVIHIEIDVATDMLKTHNVLINKSELDLQLDWLACPTLTTAPHLVELTTLYGRWGNEFQQQTQTIPHGSAVTIENRRGRTSHEHFPGLILGEKSSGEYQGQVIGVHLAWSSNYKLIVERLDNGKLYIQAGVLFAPGEMRLKSGESYRTPDLYCTFAASKMHLSHRFHEHVRNNILPRSDETRPPILCNSWEAVYFNHDIVQLKELIDRAHEVGVERLVLDDGWFLGRRSDQAGLGDWRVDLAVYPQGLHALIDYAKDKKMDFGLWFEPEMINQDSELYRDHPDWVLHDKSYPLETERNQLVLNLSHEPAFQYIFKQISQILKDYPIAYIKWDMNRTLVTPIDQDGRPAAYRQARSVYRLMNKLRQDHPKLQIETCSSGGGRVDFEVLKYCSRVWTSDNNDPLSRLTIQEGFSLFFPPEIMGCHIGDRKAHLTSCFSNIHYRSMIALQGQLGFETNLAKAAENDLTILKKYVAIYKTSRQWISQAKIYRSKCSGREASVYACVSEDARHSLWWIMTKHDNDTRTSSHFRPVGLEKNWIYRVRLASANHDELNSNLKRPMSILKDFIEIDGYSLMQMGINLPTLKPQSGLMLSIDSWQDHT